MDLSSVDYSRLLCMESGHWWSDAIWRAKRDRNNKTVYERSQQCERPGCKRKRKRTVSTKTNVPLSGYSYSGEYQKIGRVSRWELYQEQILRRQ